MNHDENNFVPLKGAMEKGADGINILKIDKNPEKVRNKAFFKKGLWGRSISKDKNLKTLKEPVLFLQREVGNTEVIEGVECGLFRIEGTSKAQILSPLKMTNIEYNGEYIKGWLSHENNAVAGFPEPIMDSEIVYQTLKKTVLNYEEFDLRKSQFKMEQLKLVAIIAGIALLTGWLWYSGNLTNILQKFGIIDLASTTTNQLAETVSSATNTGLTQTTNG